MVVSYRIFSNEGKWDEAKGSENDIEEYQLNMIGSFS
jgi:hypothetical protein